MIIIADQADGSLIIDTELDTKGFEAGSKELLSAIRSLTQEIKNLGANLHGVFSQPLTPEVNTSNAETKVAALETQVRELEAALEELQKADVTNKTATPDVRLGGIPQKTSSLQKQIDAVNTSVERLEPTFQKAMSGSTSAMDIFDGKATALENKIAELQEKLEAVGQTKIPTEDYKWLTAEINKANNELNRLYDRQAKMEGTGVKQNSSAWRNLQYDIQLAKQKLAEYSAEARSLEASGGAYTLGVDTTQYAQMEATLSAASARLQKMREGTSQSESLMSRLASSARQVASSARQVASFIGNAAKSAAGKLVSGIKSAASHMAKMVTGGKSMNKQFSGLVSGAKKFSLSLLGARGVYALLRQAVSAYMSENQQLSNTLSACWSGIGNILGPIITRLINLVAQAVAYVTSFLKLFGAFSGTATKAINSAGSAASGAAKDLKRQLASFDELNVLSDNSADGSGGGGSTDASAELPDVTLPDWAQLMVEQIEAGEWAAAAMTLTDQLNSMVSSVDWAGIGDKIEYYLNGTLTFLATAITTFDWYNLGTKLGELLNHVITGVDWSNLGIVLGAKFIVLIEGLGGLFATIDWTALGSALADGFMGLWNSIDWVQAAKTLSDGAIGILTSLSTAIKGINWQQLGNDVANFIRGINWGGIFTALSDGIGAALGGIAGFIWGLIEGAWNSVVEWWYDTAYEDGDFTMEGLLQGIWDKICDIGTWIKEHIFQPFIDGFKAAFGINSPSTVMDEQGGFIVEGLLQGITNAWNSIVDFFKNAVSGIADAISTAWSNIKSFTSETWNNIKTSLSETWNNIKSTLSTKLSGISSSMSSTFNTLKSNASTWGRHICENLANGIKNAISTVGNAVTSVANKIKSLLGFSEPEDGPLSNFHTYMPDMIDLMTYGIKSNQDKAIGAVSDMASAISEEIQNGEYAMNGEYSVNGAGFEASLGSFSDKIADSFTNLMDRLQAIAESVTFTVPAVVNGAVPYQIASTVGNSTVSSEAAIQETISAAMEDMTNGMMAGFEANLAVLKDILEAILGIEIGDEVIAKAVARYNSKMAVVRGG